MPLNKQYTRTAEIYIHKKGFLSIKILEGSIIDAEDALDNLLVIKTLSKGHKMLKLVDLRGKWTITKYAKEVSKKNVSAENTIARAYITDSFITKITLRFFQSFKNPGVPQAFFTNTQEAEVWLLSNINK